MTLTPPEGGGRSDVEADLVPRRHGLLQQLAPAVVVRLQAGTEAPDPRLQVDRLARRAWAQLVQRELGLAGREHRDEVRSLGIALVGLDEVLHLQRVLVADRLVRPDALGAERVQADRRLHDAPLPAEADG